MIDEEIKQDLERLDEVFNHEAIRKIRSHLLSLSMKIETLTRQRDLWKERLIKKVNCEKETKGERK